MDIKTGVFNAAEYDGGFFFNKIFPKCTKMAFFTIFWGKNIFFKKIIWVSK